MSINKRLKELRKKFNLSQQELANRLNINRSTYARYETGDTQPDIETIKKLANFFDVSIDYLLGRSDKVTKPVQKTDELTEKDEKDIAKRLEQFRKDIEGSDGLAFDGEPLSDEAKESVIEAMEYIMRTTKRINKKYTPKKYRKDDVNEQ